MVYIGVNFVHSLLLYYCTGCLAYNTLRFLITSFIVTIAKYVEITTMQGTRKIVKKNFILDNIRYIAINASGKSIAETKSSMLLFVSFTEIMSVVFYRNFS